MFLESRVQPARNADKNAISEKELSLSVMGPNTRIVSFLLFGIGTIITLRATSIHKHIIFL
jgi:hypothetical protein